MSCRLVLHFFHKEQLKFSDLDVPVIAKVKKTDIISFVGEENDVAIKSAAQCILDGTTWLDRTPMQARFVPKREKKYSARSS
jgi:hypothetical protein